MALPSFLCPCVILSLNDQVTCGPPNQRTRSISPFGLREFRFSNSACSWSISPGVHDPMTRVPFGSTVMILSHLLDFRDFNLRYPSTGVDRRMRVLRSDLSDQTSRVHFGTSTFRTSEILSFSSGKSSRSKTPRVT
jgi:hypothetical protein